MNRIARKIPGLLAIICLCGVALLNSGTVRRKQTALTKGQTSGIKLKDKLEEVKDGEKGPATPSFGWYGGENGFMSEPPFSKDAPGAPPEAEVPHVSEVELSEPLGRSHDEGDENSEDTWDEDWSEDELKGDEALPATADTDGDVVREASAGAQSSDTPKEDEASKWDKDWWDEI